MEEQRGVLTRDDMVYSRRIQAEVHRAAGAYTGCSTIKQSDFAIDPVSVAGGIVKVKNEVEIQLVVVSIRK